MREWQEFFDVLPGTGQEACYRIYHDSFRDFLQEDVDPGLQEHHRMIADSILRRATRGENRDG